MDKNYVDKKSNWVKIGNGFLKIGHKPFGRKVSAQSLLNDKTDLVLTILSEKEGAVFIGEQCKAVGIDWIWLPLPNGNIPPNSKKQEIMAAFEKVKEKLSIGKKVYIHCSAGIHRTGMISHAFLQFLGYDNQRSLEILSELRPLTGSAVGEQRLEWGRQLGV